MLDLLDLLSSFSDPEDILEGIFALVAGSFSVGAAILPGIISIGFWAFVIAARWKVYNKAGEHGWAAIVPFYNSYIMYKITWGTGWLFLLNWFLPMALITRAKLARAFNKKSAFIVGTIFFEEVFTIVLGFTSAQYCGIEGEGVVKATDALRGLLGLSGQWNGAQICDDLDDGFTIGRDAAQCNIVIMQNNSKVSRKHCTVAYDDVKDEYIVVDYSSNGTFLSNGTKLDAGVPTTLPSGTTLVIGDKDNMFKLL